MMQCQREAARFAAGPARVDELRHLAVKAAVRRLRAGNREAALDEMYAGLARQAPLTFKPPTTAAAATVTP